MKYIVVSVFNMSVFSFKVRVLLEEYLMLCTPTLIGYIFFLSYCDCFANGEFCREGCHCHNCKNNMEHTEERAKAVKVC